MIAIASFRIDSPKINAKRFLSQFSSLKIESTATGSVELFNDPNAKLPLSPRFYIHKKTSMIIDKRNILIFPCLCSQINGSKKSICTVDSPIHPTKKRRNEVDNIAIDVPMSAYPKILPKFLKKYFCVYLFFVSISKQD